MTKEMRGHVEIAYKDAIDNIQFCKRQQWVVTNYAIAAYAALYSIAPRQDYSVLRTLLILVAIAICVYHFCALMSLQRLMTRLRLRLAHIYEDYFEAEERYRLDLSAKAKSFWHQPGLLIGLIAVSVIGAVIVSVAVIGGSGISLLR